jgi:hypothetical protein
VEPKRSPRLSKRGLSRLGVGIVVLALVSGANPIPTNAAVAGASAAGKMTLGEHLQVLAKVGKNYLARLRPEIVQRLSAGGQSLIKLTEQVQQVQDLAAKGQAAQAQLKTKAQGPSKAGADLANDPFAAEDLFSRMSGMTQSETSAGWCGSNAVIGFNDSGSFVASAFLALSPSGSLSFNGWSQSTDAGASYTDRGALISDPIPANLEFRDLLGDPVIGCTSVDTFYYASLAVSVGPQATFVNSDITVSPSYNGGTTFAAAVPAASKDAFMHFLDKPWMSVEPGPTASASDDVLHVSYTDFDVSGFSGQGPCIDQERIAIEYVRSTDGGQTWSAPQVIEEVCGNDGFVQGSQVEHGVGDDVFVAWERYPADFVSAREIRIRRSVDLGASFGPTTAVTPVTPLGDGFALQGLFRTFLDLQGLAVDKSNGPRRGTVYLTFHDGSNRQKPDPFGICLNTATYCFGDAMLTKSGDGGATWSAPVRINNDDIRLGIDQWFPAVDVDRSGKVWVSYHDRRRDVRNFLIDTFVASSTNGGTTWTNSRATKVNFAPITGWQDLVVNPIYMGDYIAVAADATGSFNGVITAWGDNALGDQNVGQRRY